MIVLARYTTRGQYPAYAERLRASCQRFGLAHDIAKVDDGGNWSNVCNDRPNWILQALCNARQSILCVDADCEFQKFPSLLVGQGCDFAAYNWSADPLNAGANGPNRHTYNPERLLVSGGVMLFGYTAAAMEFLVRWISKIGEAPGTTVTDPLIDFAYNTYRPPLSTLWLPRSYNFLSPLWGKGEDAVILHHYFAGALRENPELCATRAAEMAVQNA